MNEHNFYMNKAINLAKKGYGKTNPNPLVGAVIVKNGIIIGTGFHKAFGLSHAEVNAINNATEDVFDSTLYVNLEPCSHFGKTPPCVNAIINAKIKEVVIAMKDPNPLVSGKGIEILEQAGIKVTLGVLEQKAKILNEIFIKYITLKKPFVILKSAMTLDGKIATYTGNSKYITGEIALKHTHNLRNRISAIMVGVDTLIIDNPFLNTRLKNKNGNCPIPIVVDSTGKIPLESKVINSEKGLILATTSKINKDKEAQLLNKGVKIIKCDSENGKVNLNTLMDELYKINIDSVLLEGGGNLNWSALQSKIVDKVFFYYAPKLIGGQTAKTSVEGIGFASLNDAIDLKDIKFKKIGEDFLVEGYLSK